MFTVDLSHIQAYALEKKKLSIDEGLRSDIERSFAFLNDFSKNKVIYGINTGFGPMAQYKIAPEELHALQYNLIRSHASGTGLPLDDESVRAVLLARIANFLQGNSGISYPVIEQLLHFLNKDIIPEIYEHGGVGASGDLVQLAHLALSLIGEGKVRYKGERIDASEALQLAGLKPLELQLRDGLGLMNGTSCMTGIGAVNLVYAYRLLDLSIQTSAVINELVEAYDDSFSVGLNRVKQHSGQQYVAAEMRRHLQGSELIKKREELYDNEALLESTQFKKKIQEYYSIRCVPQILGPVKDTLDFAKEVIENELNSTNDNPVISVSDQTVYHGGNFHGDYVSLEMDKVKLVVTKLTMLAERQLNFLLNARINDQFPAFLNAEKLGFNFGLQGIQFTAVSTTAESQTLSNPMYVHSISNNNDNQDIVSMGTNSALLTKRVIENGFQVMAIHVMAVCQAIDLLDPEKKQKLAPETLKLHQQIRELVPMVRKDVMHSENIRIIINEIKNRKTL